MITMRLIRKMQEKQTKMSNHGEKTSLKFIS